MSLALGGKKCGALLPPDRQAGRQTHDDSMCHISIASHSRNTRLNVLNSERLQKVLLVLTVLGKKCTPV